MWSNWACPSALLGEEANQLFTFGAHDLSQQQ
jgi:hypothetical protein